MRREKAISVLSFYFDGDLIFTPDKYPSKKFTNISQKIRA
jgi:hypothetical protein